MADEKYDTENCHGVIGVPPSSCSLEDEQPTTTIVHLDVDAFYVACERELRPELRGRPIAVSQYNPYGDLREYTIEDPGRIVYDGYGSTADERHTKKTSNPNTNGSMIAVSYEARARNVKRNDRGLEAIAKCPELCIVQVPVSNGKANLNIYRNASERLMTVLADAMKSAASEVYKQVATQNTSTAATSTTPNTNTNRNDDNANDEKQKQQSLRRAEKSLNDIIVEKASVDEIYIDISSPVRAIIGACRTGGAISWNALYTILTATDSASTHTTIGGLETSEAAIATNRLSKDDIRRGSSLQVVDSEDAARCNAAMNLQQTMWWNRSSQPFPRSWRRVEIALAIGALITLKARRSVVETFEGVFTLSAGVSTNKVMSKLASGLKKPNRQTLINPNDESTLQKLFHPLPIGRIRGLGGKFGTHIEEILNIKTVGELAKVPLTLLQEKFDPKQAEFLYRIAQGICDEPVAERTKSKRVGAGKTFRGILAIQSSDHDNIKKWLTNLASEVTERATNDSTRYAKTLTCWLNMEIVSSTENFRPGTGRNKHQRKAASHSTSLPRQFSANKCAELAFQLARDVIANTRKAIPENTNLVIIGMGVAASNFVEIEQGTNSILDAFKRINNQQEAAKTSSLTPSADLEFQRSAIFTGCNAKHVTAKKPKILRGIESFLKVTPAASPKLITNNPSAGHPIVIIEGANNQCEIRGSSHGVDKECQLLDVKLSSEVQQQRDFQDAGDSSGDVSVSNVQSVNIITQAREAYSTTSKTSPATTISATHCTDQEEADADLEYAKQLQASFDRENEVLSLMEKRGRRSSISAVVESTRGKRKSSSMTRVTAASSSSRRGVGDPSSSSQSCISINHFFVKKSKQK